MDGREDAALTAGSPVVVRMNAAVAELNAAEAALIHGLPGADPGRARMLAERVRVAREEFGAAFNALEAAT